MNSDDASDESALDQVAARYPPNGSKSLALALIGLPLSEHESVEKVCQAFDISRSSYYDYRSTKGKVDSARERLKSQVQRVFLESRGSAGSRTVKRLLVGDGTHVGRFLVRRLMAESGLVSKQPGPHKYKQADIERLDIPNRLDRQFTVDRPDQIWCGDITYWAGSRWVYLAAVIDLYARRVIGWSVSEKADACLTIKALGDAYNRRSKPEGVMFHSDQGCQYSSLVFRQHLWRYGLSKA